MDMHQYIQNKIDNVFNVIINGYALQDSIDIFREVEQQAHAQADKLEMKLKPEPTAAPQPDNEFSRN